jgi:hypothetical protein
VAALLKLDILDVAAALHGANPETRLVSVKGAKGWTRTRPRPAREATPATTAPERVGFVSVGPTTLASQVAADARQFEREQEVARLVSEQQVAERTEAEVARWAQGWPTVRERRATQYVDHLRLLSQATTTFGAAEESAWGLDGGRALEAARQAARVAVVATIQPIFDAALAELEAARRERAELVKAHGG